MDAEAPCCSLGLIEVRNQQVGLLAIRPSDVIPANATSDGFNLGHSVLGGADYEVIHFAFEFLGVGTYNVLVNHSSPVVKTVVRNIIEQGDYFIMVIQPNDGVTVFRAGSNPNDLGSLKDNLQRILDSTTTEALRRFSERSHPPGQLLTWVCRNDVSYLDLTKSRIGLNPSSR